MENQKLTEIYIKIGIKYISDAIKINKTLTEIELRNNWLGKTIAMYLCDTLNINKSLTSIN